MCYYATSVLSATAYEFNLAPIISLYDTVTVATYAVSFLTLLKVAAEVMAKHIKWKLRVQKNVKIKKLLK